MSKVAELLVALKSERPMDRRSAAAKLHEIPRELELREVGILLEISLGDSEWRVRREAVRSATIICQNRECTHLLIPFLVQVDNIGLRSASTEVFAALGTDGTPILLNALAEHTGDEQKFVVRALGDAGDDAAVPHLVNALEAGAGTLTMSLIDALAQIGGRVAQTALARVLRSDDPLHRMAALDGLSRLTSTLSWDELEGVVEDRMVARVAIPLLGRTGDARALSVVVRAFRNGAPAVSSVQALSSLADAIDDDDMVIDALSMFSASDRHQVRELLLTPELSARQSAAHLSVLLRDHDALEAVLGLLAMGDVSASTLRSLSTFPSATSSCLDIAENTRCQSDVRGCAVEIASDLLVLDKDPDARDEERERLIGRLQKVARTMIHQKGTGTEFAARALAPFAQTEDVLPLFAVYREGKTEAPLSAGVMERLAESYPDEVKEHLRTLVFDTRFKSPLAELTASLLGEESLSSLRYGISATSPAVRRACVTALGTLGLSSATSAVTLALVDDDPSVRRCAAQTLGQIHGRRDSDEEQEVSIEPLLVAAVGNDSVVSAAAVDALGKARVAESIPVLRELVASSLEDEGRNATAVASLHALDQVAEVGFETLTRALEHRDKEVVKATLRILSWRGAPVTLLSRGLTHPSWDVRALCVQILSARGGEAIEVLRKAQLEETDAYVIQQFPSLGTEPR